MLTDKDERPANTGSRIIYSDAYASEMVAFADLVLPDTTYLERHDCISLLDRPISEPTAPADAIRQPVVEPDRDVRAVPVGADRPRRAARPPRLGRRRRHGRDTGDYADYIVNHERTPGIGPLAGWRGEDGVDQAGRAQSATSWSATSTTAASGTTISPRTQRYYKHGNRAYLDWARRNGLHRQAAADRLPALLRAAAEVPARRAGPWPRASRPSSTAHAHRSAISIRCRSGTRRSRRRASTRRTFRCTRVTQRPMAMYHSWGSQNAWLRQIHGQQRALRAPGTAAELGLERRRLGLGRLSRTAASTVQVAANGRRQARHGVDLERDRQAPRRLEPGARRARSQQRLPAQPPDRRAAAAGSERHALRQCRSGHRPGGLVRPAGAHREGGRAEPSAAGDRRAASRGRRGCPSDMPRGRRDCAGERPAT